MICTYPADPLVLVPEYPLGDGCVAGTPVRRGGEGRYVALTASPSAERCSYMYVILDRRHDYLPGVNVNWYI